MLEFSLLARNIILYTLVLDQEYPKNSQLLWNIFYHLLLDETSLSLLLDQCRKLVGLSIDLATWAASEYSSFLEIGSKFTLDELRSYWSLCIESDSFTPSRKKQIKSKFLSRMSELSQSKEHSLDMSAGRSAGPLFFDAMSMAGTAGHLYWKTGITSQRQSDVDAAVHINPTFAFSNDGEGSMAHYGTNPLMAFHLAPTFVESSSGEDAPSLDAVYDAIKIQFSSWCSAFRDAVRDHPGNIKLRMLVGDALAACQTFQVAAAGGDPSVLPRVLPWKGSLSTLDGHGYADGTAPLTFDVIDTSNLCDHLGGINLLLASTPLLKQTPTATLYTETLLPFGEDPMASITERFCGDLTTISLLLNLTPISYLCGYTMRSNVHEIISYHMQEHSRQYHERLTWKIPSQLNRAAAKSRPIALEPTQLAVLLFDIYKRMFAHEDFNDYFQTMSISSLKRQENIAYCRKSFALLVRYLIPRIHVNWDKAILGLFERIMGATTLVMGPNHYQDLLLHLHLFGIYSPENFVPKNPELYRNKDVGRFRQWTSVPPIVCVAFEVPRSQIRILEEDSTPSHPALAVHICTSTFSNYFSSIELMFGTLEVSGSGDSAIGTVIEDPLGKRGSSSVVIAAQVPAWILVQDPLRTLVQLVVISTPRLSVLVRRLGIGLQLFNCRLSDTAKTHVLKGRPGVQGPVSLAYIPNIQPMDFMTSSSVSVILDGAAVAAFVRRVNITEAKAKAALALSSTPVTVEHISAFEAEVSIGEVHRERVAFPFSVDASKVKIRVAQRSSWVEVFFAPIAETSDADNSYTDRHPACALWTEGRAFH
jgi:hypothetical protein